MRSFIELFFLAVIAITTTSCAFLMENRTFIDEMEKDDEEFVMPGRDFRITAGDSGKVFRNEKEIQERTPLDGEEKAQFIADKRLNTEFETLYAAQSDFALKHYHRFKRYLPTLSEKIYFLRLESLTERNTYLYSKNAPVYKDMQFVDYRRPANQITVGMNKSDVRSAWGRPTRRDVAGNPAYENERWAYFEGGKIKFVYFEGGKVQGWSMPE